MGAPSLPTITMTITRDGDATEYRYAFDNGFAYFERFEKGKPLITGSDFAARAEKAYRDDTFASLITDQILRKLIGARSS